MDRFEPIKEEIRAAAVLAWELERAWHEQPPAESKQWPEWRKRWTERAKGFVLEFAASLRIPAITPFMSDVLFYVTRSYSGNLRLLPTAHMPHIQEPWSEADDHGIHVSPIKQQDIENIQNDPWFNIWWNDLSEFCFLSIIYNNLTGVMEQAKPRIHFP